MKILKFYRYILQPAYAILLTFSFRDKHNDVICTNRKKNLV